MPIGFETFNGQGGKLFDQNTLTAKYRGVYTSPVWTNSGTRSGTIQVLNKDSNDTIFYYPILLERRQANGQRDGATGLQVSTSGNSINWYIECGTWGGGFVLIYGVY